MRLSRTLPALASGLAAAALLAPAAARATTSGPAASPAATCTWHALAPPPGPPSVAGQGAQQGVDAVAPNDVWFPGMQPGGARSWTVRWNGRAFQVPAQLPPNLLPLINFRFLDGASFDSSTDGWELFNYTYLEVPGGSGGVSPVIAARWNGGRWTVTPMAVSPDPQQTLPDPGAVAALSSADAWAVGSFDTSVGPAGALTEHWDGTQWNLVPNPAATQQGAHLNALTAVSSTNVWAVGEQGNGTPLVEHWNGHSWSSVPAPPGTGQVSFLDSISADGPGDIWASGVQGTPGSFNPLVEHWDGSTWHVAAGLPNVGTTGGLSSLPDVYAASPGDVWVTFQPQVQGPFGPYGATPGSFLHWDGTTWTAVPVPTPAEHGGAYTLTGISGTGSGDVWAVGNLIEGFDQAGALLPIISQVYHCS